MRSHAALTTAALSGALCVGLAAAGCSGGAGGEAAPGTDASSAASATSPTTSPTTSPASEDAAPAVVIADDFPLSAGMGGPGDVVATSRTGTGLRDLALCGTTLLRGLDVRDRMVADNSGGESANTRELVLLGSSDEAAAVAQSFADLPATCGGVEATGGGTEVVTDVRASPFGPSPAATLVQTYTFDGEPGPGATVVHVVPVGPALLVSSTYGEWRTDELDDGIAATRPPLRATVAAMAAYDGVGVG